MIYLVTVELCFPPSILERLLDQWKKIKIPNFPHVWGKSAARLCSKAL